MMKKSISSLLLIGSIVFAMPISMDDCKHLAKETNVTKLTKKDIPCAALLVKEEVGQNLPQMIDSHTTLVFVNNSNEGVHYIYEVDTKNNEAIKQALTKMLKESMTQIYCSDEELVFLMNLEMIFEHTYQENNQLISKITLTKKNCEGK